MTSVILLLLLQGEAIVPPVVALPTASVVREVMPVGWRLVRMSLPDKGEDESVVIAFDLAAGLKGRTVAAVSWRANGLELSDVGISADGKRVQVTIAGGYCGGIYTVGALCTLSDGTAVEPWGLLRAKAAGA